MCTYYIVVYHYFLVLLSCHSRESLSKHFSVSHNDFNAVLGGPCCRLHSRAFLR